MKHPSIKCPTCKGHGAVPLSRSLELTLNAVKASGGISAMEVHNQIKSVEDIKVSAIHNRLVLLERNGLVKRVKKVGKFWRWV